MAEFRIDAEELKGLVKDVVAEVLRELDQFKLLINGKIAFSEPDAAQLLGLHPWQLRDLRLAGRVGYSRIAGNRVRYSVNDLLEYLRQGHQRGTPKG